MSPYPVATADLVCMAYLGAYDLSYAHYTLGVAKLLGYCAYLDNYTRLVYTLTLAKFGSFGALTLGHWPCTCFVFIEAIGQ